MKSPVDIRPERDTLAMSIGTRGNGNEFDKIDKGSHRQPRMHHLHLFTPPLFAHQVDEQTEVFTCAAIKHDSWHIHKPHMPTLRPRTYID